MIATPIAGALREAVSAFGPDILASPRRLRAILSDILGPEAREQRASLDALCLAAQSRELVDLISVSADQRQKVIAELVARLRREGLSGEMAENVGALLAAALPPADPSGPGPEENRLSTIEGVGADFGVVGASVRG